MFELNQINSNSINTFIHIPMNATKAIHTAPRNMTGHRNNVHPVANPAVIINHPKSPINANQRAVVP